MTNAFVNYRYIQDLKISALSKSIIKKRKSALKLIAINEEGINKLKRNHRNIHAKWELVISKLQSVDNRTTPAGVKEKALFEIFGLASAYLGDKIELFRWNHGTSNSSKIGGDRTKIGNQIVSHSICFLEIRVLKTWWISQETDLELKLRAVDELNSEEYFALQRKLHFASEQFSLLTNVPVEIVCSSDLGNDDDDEGLAESESDYLGCCSTCWLHTPLGYP
jgi:hypothetical protein